MSKKRVFVGVDLGAKGAIAVIDKDNNVLELIDYSSNFADDWTLIKEKYDVSMIVAEKISSMPGQGVKSMFSFGHKLGEFEGILHTLGLPYVLVRPQEWMKGLGLPKDKNQRKKAINSIAKSMFPDAVVTGKRGGILDGRSDSLLIAQYCKKNY